MLRFLVLFFLTVAFPAHATDRLLVFAAASQKDAMEEIGSLYEQKCTCAVVFSFAATSTLARQIAAGAEADVFVSANEAWADWL
ncbi:MAG: substrate-binding domain-containing protein, partial [Pseudomonadota bacterium]